MAKKYAEITAMIKYRVRYIAEMDDDEESATPYSDFVVCDQIEEFSQLYLGETIIDSRIITKDEVIAQFDADFTENESTIFLDWDDEHKLQNVLTVAERDKL